jgi:UPF0716 family protein affecting phage T7 exclusion
MLAVAAILLVAPELTTTLIGIALFAPVALRPVLVAGWRGRGENGLVPCQRAQASEGEIRGPQ